MNKYTNSINIINNTISEFNGYLNLEYQLETLDLFMLSDNDYFLNLKNKTWNDYSFPRNREVGGVYLYFGFNIADTNDICVYVGKASYSRTLGQRLWDHFRYKEHITFENEMYYKNGTYAIEMITSIPLEKENTVFLASALEEFLIKKLSGEGIQLFNSVGNG
jgi:hypothetical protein